MLNSRAMSVVVRCSVPTQQFRLCASDCVFTSLVNYHPRNAIDPGWDLLVSRNRKCGTDGTVKIIAERDFDRMEHRVVSLV